MRVLIIEDDEFKQRRIAQAMQSLRPGVDVRSERSVNSGLKGILEWCPDLILLDMSLTTFDVGPREAGGRPQNFGGLEILRQMERLQVVIPVIVITQHERFANGSEEVHLSAIHTELKDLHGQVFRGLVYYNSAAGGWEKHLRDHVNRATKGENVNKSPRRRR